MIVLASVNENIEPITLNQIDIFFLTIKKRSQLTIKDIDDKIRIKPIFKEFVIIKQKELGLSFRLWSKELLNKIQLEFSQKYLE